MTGCARFIIALIILIPLAYFAAKFINGGEGIPEVEEFLDRMLNK